MSKAKLSAVKSNPTSPLDLPDSLPDKRSVASKAKGKGKKVLDAAAESAIVDQATNAAAVIVREKGQKNKKALAVRIDEWLDDVAKGYGGFAGRIILMLPIKSIVSKGIDKLIDVVADWLEEFSDASEDDNV